MKLQDVLQKVEPKEITGACDIEISGVQIDSRQITKGDLFVAERGTQVDGHKHPLSETDNRKNRRKF